MSNPLPPTPTLSTPSPSTSLSTSTVSVAVPPASQLNNTVAPPSSSGDQGPSTFGLPNPTVPGVMMSTAATTVVQGIFGVGAIVDPPIIVGLVLAGLIFLVLLGALIYCCCTHCCVPPTTQHVTHVIKRSPSFQTIHHQERGPTRPIYLTASLTPEYSSSADHPAASVFLQQPLRVTVGAYEAGYGGGGYGGGSGSMMVAGGGSYPRRMHQQMIEPDVIVTRVPEEHQVIMPTLSRKKYLYPADLVGVGNDVTYNTIRPTIISRSTPVITTLGDGYAMGHSLRSTGNRYGGGGGRNLLLYQDDPSPQIITLY